MSEGIRSGFTLNRIQNPTVQKGTEERDEDPADVHA